MNPHHSSHSHILPVIVKRKPIDESLSSSLTFSTTISYISNTHHEGPANTTSSCPASPITNHKTADAKTRLTPLRTHKLPKTPDSATSFRTAQLSTSTCRASAWIVHWRCSENGVLSISSYLHIHQLHNHKSHCSDDHSTSSMIDTWHFGDIFYYSIITVSFLEH